MSIRSRWLSIFVVGWLLSSAQVARASAYCGGSNPGRAFIWLYRNLTAGTTYTIKTTNITGDPVMHLMRQNSGGATTGYPWVQVAWNDDSDSTLASKIVYTPSVSGTYAILVRSYSSTSNGVADVVINGTTALQQNSYGSYVWTGANWKERERVRVTSTRRNGGNDSMLFLLTDNGSVWQMDDDSGPNLDSYVAASINAAATARVVWGNYPGHTGSMRVTIEPEYSSAGDWDGDFVVDALETACGMDPLWRDGDRDGISDNWELFGNEGFSFSQGSQYGDSHKRRNVYVEVDTMADPDVTPPYAGLASDVTQIFNTDGGLDIYVEVKPAALPYSRLVALTSCANNDGVVQANCTTIGALKDAYFSRYSEERQRHFRYAVFGDQLFLEGAPKCNSGVADGSGQYALVTLSTQQCGFSASVLQQRGTFVHELGHNLRLSHNGNDDADGDFSVVHGSVMNYRYQMSGVNWRPAGVLKSTYSFGAGGCTACDTSPKQRCIDARWFALLFSDLTGTPTTCSAIDPSCDCDVDEWGHDLWPDFLNGTAPTPGASAAPQAADAGAADAAGDEALLPDEVDMLRAAFAANTVTRAEGLLKPTGPGTFRGPLPDLAARRRHGRVQRRVAELKARGLVEGRHFVVAADGSTFYEKCL